MRVSKLSALVFAAVVGWGHPSIANDTDITPQQAQVLAAGSKLLLIDVRTPEEWRQTGVPVGARPINLRDPAGPAAFVEQVLAAVGNDKAKPIAVICRSGNRSAQAQRLLQAQGFTNVTNVVNGMLGNDGPGWLAAGLPVEKCATC